MKLRELETILEQVQVFPNPKQELEQYPTSPQLASQILFNALEDIEDKVVVDLGSGAGMLTLGAACLGARQVIGIDIDPDALEVARENQQRVFDEEDEEPITWIQFDISNLHNATPPLLEQQNIDTVVMNPPFGTRVKGADMLFLEAACNLGPSAIYTLHKTSTRAFVLRKLEQWGWRARVFAELRFDLKASYKHHSKKSVDIAVDLIHAVPLNQTSKSSSALP